MTDKYFVIVQGLRGPEPQVWHDMQTKGEGKEKPVLWKKKLEPNQHRLDLKKLGELFADEFSRLSGGNS